MLSDEGCKKPTSQGQECCRQAAVVMDGVVFILVCQPSVTGRSSSYIKTSRCTQSCQHFMFLCSIADEMSCLFQCLLSTVGNWSFNIFNLDKLTNGE